VEVGVAYFKILSWHLSGGTEKNRKQLKSGESVPLPVFEMDAFRMQVRRAADRAMVQAVTRRPLTA
jgi:hypothetical protein